jgi:hypothetical protein
MMSTDGYRLEANDAPAIRRERGSQSPMVAHGRAVIQPAYRDAPVLFNIAQISEVND